MTDKTRRVLLIDDDLGDTLLLKKLIHAQAPDATIEIEQDPETALQKLEVCAARNLRELPDVILLDINMPRMNGFELKQRLSEISTLNTIPVIFLTTSSAPSDIDNAYKLGGNAYLTKPGDLGGMRRVVESFSAFWLRSAQLPQR
ncbi:MAG: response regulator [Myxococcota bacterium]|nr:response regulator [Myxococcota bacterium]MEC9442450.1 response regulator [Myxococcota bacterium]